jgi:predicted choloylglycine hydrolase
MAYNVSLVDARGDAATIEVAPDRPARLTRDEKAATNHQHEAVWAAHAARTRSLERRRLLEERLADPTETPDGLVGRFLAPPLFTEDYAHALGTLYTAAYDPSAGTMELLWPDAAWRSGFGAFEEKERVVTYLQKTTDEPR